MLPERITLRRQDLYEKVWSTPMQKLAKEFGLSDVGLAKLCRRHKIPVPGRGYWARLAAGQKPTRIPLATVEDRLGTIEIHPSDRPAVERDATGEKQPIPTIEVAGDRPITHPLALQVERSILRSTDEKGALLARKGRVVPINASPVALPRAVRILDALLFALQEAGHKLEWPKPYNTPLKVIVLEEAFGFSISEVARAKPHTLTLQESARPWSAPKWDYEPTGRLKLSIDCGHYSGIRHAWTDGKKQRTEKCLGRFLVALPMLANALKRERQEQAERERRWAEQRKREEEERRWREEYERKAKIVEKFAHSWEKGKLLREFSVALKAVAEGPSLPDDQKQELNAMVDFAVRHAAYVDPLTHPKWMADNFKNPPWQYGF